MILTYRNSGERRYGDNPVGGGIRSGWEFQCTVRGTCWPSVAPLMEEGYSPGRLWVFPKDSRHYWIDEPGRVSEIRVIHATFVPPALERLLSNRTYLGIYLSNTKLQSVAAAYESLFSVYDDQRGLNELKALRAVIELSEQFIEIEPLPGESQYAVSDSEKIARATEWYCQHLSEGPTVEQVAASIHLTSTHLRRLFLKVEGRNPKDCFRSIRMELAEYYLNSTQLGLGEIAHRLGYSELSAFSRAFRLHSGNAPSAKRSV